MNLKRGNVYLLLIIGILFACIFTPKMIIEGHDQNHGHGSVNHGSVNHGSVNHGSVNHGSVNHGSVNHGSGSGTVGGYYGIVGGDSTINPLFFDEYSYDNVYFVDEYGYYYPRVFYYTRSLWPW